MSVKQIITDRSNTFWNTKGKLSIDKQGRAMLLRGIKLAEF